MLLHKSNMYVSQPVGRFFSTDTICGYYNDLTKKVYSEKSDFGMLPLDEETKKTTEFPIQVFQYGLGAYDCFLETGDSNFLKTVFSCADFALNKQNQDGGWETFRGRENPFSSMAQGEGISLLLRAFLLTKDNKFYEAAKKAMSFLKKETMVLSDDGPLFYEFVGSPLVLNGWIFTIFGLFDFALLTKQPEDIDFLNSSIDALAAKLSDFDDGKWSLYREDGRFASRFYLFIHIAQLKALFIITKRPVFEEYLKRWTSYYKNPFKRIYYFWRKAYQKIKEKV